MEMDAPAHAKSSLASAARKPLWLSQSAGYNAEMGLGRIMKNVTMGIIWRETDVLTVWSKRDSSATMTKTEDQCARSTSVAMDSIGKTSGKNVMMAIRLMEMGAVTSALLKQASSASASKTRHRTALQSEWE